VINFFSVNIQEKIKMRLMNEDLSLSFKVNLMNLLTEDFVKNFLLNRTLDSSLISLNCLQPEVFYPYNDFEKTLKNAYEERDYALQHIKNLEAHLSEKSQITDIDFLKEMNKRDLNALDNNTYNVYAGVNNYFEELKIA
jgi:hypothetical protein